MSTLRCLAARRLQLALLLVVLVVTGCSQTPRAGDEPVTEEPTAEQDPPAEELAEHPCGTKKWEEPPPEVTSLSE